MARKKSIRGTSYQDPATVKPLRPNVPPGRPVVPTPMAGTRVRPTRVLSDVQRKRRAARQALGIGDVRSATVEQLNAARFAGALGKGTPVTDRQALAVASTYAGGKGGPAGG